MADGQICFDSLSVEQKEKLHLYKEETQGLCAFKVTDNDRLSVTIFPDVLCKWLNNRR